MTARVRDLDSSNGTFVAGRRIGEAVLSHGDEIVAGNTIFSVSLLGGPQAPGAGLQQTESFTIVDAAQRDTASSLPFVSSSASFDPVQVILNIVSGPFSEERKQELSRLLTWFGAGETVVVGTSSSNAKMRILADKKLSDRHFEVLCDGWSCRLRDLDSEHGTRLNGKPIREAILRDGDTILAGETTFQVKIKGGPPILGEESEAKSADPETH
jgi:pSer/pThr/pTyr-binding forkhead associated (FHA) protein